MECIKCGKPTELRWWWIGRVLICGDCWWQSWLFLKGHLKGWSETTPPGRLWAAADAKECAEAWLRGMPCESHHRGLAQ